MNCIFCGTRAKVIDVAHYGKDTYRKHSCSTCGDFYSREKVIPGDYPEIKDAFSDKWKKDREAKREKEKKND